MRRGRLLAAYVALVLLPLFALAWLSARLARAEVARANARVAELALGALRVTAGDVSALLDQRRRRILELLAVTPRQESALREASRRLPFVRQGFWVNPHGQLAYPSPGGDLDREEAAFLRRTASLWVGGRLAARAGETREREGPGAVTPAAAGGLGKLLGHGDSSAEASASQRQEAAVNASSGDAGVEIAPAAGWHPWHLEDGLHVLCWQRLADGSLLGAELDRVRLLADLIAELPDPDPSLASGRLRLLDAEGRILHQWGALDPGQRPAAARLALSPPLAAWSFEYFDSGTGEPGLAAAASGALPWLAGVAVLVLGLAVHVYRESTREFAEAKARVSFVNQVSHELKTPLTNVRMFAELLETEVADEPVAARYAAVIVGEAQRLSRLIGNVLAFARHERHELRLRRRQGVIDEVVARVLATFAPALSARGIAVEQDLGAQELVTFDHDACEQILGNLLANVEKYAAAGALARVTTTRRGRFAVLTVADRGPGVAAALRERVFSPFYRVSNAVTEGVSGAGLGLTIARELARLHGGDLALQDSERGATFEARLDVVGGVAEGADSGAGGEPK